MRWWILFGVGACGLSEADFDKELADAVCQARDRCDEIASEPVCRRAIDDDTLVDMLANASLSARVTETQCYDDLAADNGDPNVLDDDCRYHPGRAARCIRRIHDNTQCPFAITNHDIYAACADVFTQD